VVQVFLKEVAEKLGPPRALWVPFDHGYPLGAPNDEEQQLDVLRQTFALLDRPGPPPVLADYVPGLVLSGGSSGDASLTL
jgi:hypothetical protein